MTQEETLAHIMALEKDVVKLQLRLRDLYVQIREGLDNDSPVE